MEKPKGNQSEKFLSFMKIVGNSLTVMNGVERLALIGRNLICDGG
jgi:hypothetical protein